MVDDTPMTREERNVAAEILWVLITLNFLVLAAVLWLQKACGG